jgi:hypothetical protein
LLHQAVEVVGITLQQALQALRVVLVVALVAIILGQPLYLVGLEYQDKVILAVLQQVFTMVQGAVALERLG